MRTLLSMMFLFAVSAFATNGVTYDVVCSPRDDMCQYENVELSRKQLLEYIPIAQDTSDCMDEFCYNDTFEVIGLNPDYGLYMK